MTEQYPRLAALLSRMSRLRRPSWVDDTFGWAVVEIAREPEVHARILAAACCAINPCTDDGRAEAAVIADRLQAEGDRWGHYLAALLEPLARPELEDEIADLLEGVLQRRERRRLILRAAEIGLVEIDGETNAALRLRILGAQSSQSIDSFSRSVGRSLAPAFSSLAASMTSIVGPLSSLAREVQRMEQDEERRRHLSAVFGEDAVAASETDTIMLDSAEWIDDHDISLGYEPPRPVIEEPPRGPGIGPGLARRLRKRGRHK